VEKNHKHVIFGCTTHVAKFQMS